MNDPLASSRIAMQLSEQALAAIAQLAEPHTWEALRLTNAERFEWLPTNGGLIRDLEGYSGRPVEVQADDC